MLSPETGEKIERMMNVAVWDVGLNSAISMRKIGPDVYVCKQEEDGRWTAQAKPTDEAVQKIAQAIECGVCILSPHHVGGRFLTFNEFFELATKPR